MRAVEEPNCPLCGVGEKRALFRFGEFGVVRCTECGFSFLSPRLPEAEMLALYSSGDYFEAGTVGYASYSDQEASLRATFRGVVRNLVRHGFAGGDLLEIGAGYGFLLEEASAKFRTSTGTEYSAEAVAAARQRGLNVVEGGLDALTPDARFDCIFCGHVLEHVYEPHAFMAQVVGRLKPGGAVVIGTPNMGSLWRRLMRSRWPSFKIPEHVTYFDRGSMARLMTQAGLTQIRSFPYPHAFPMALVVSKAGLPSLARRLGRLRNIPIWLPQTTLALSARAPGLSDR